MHVNCLQIFDTDFYSDIEYKALSKDEMFDELDQWIDYVTNYDTSEEKEAVRAFLVRFAENGCSVNYDTRTFTVNNKDAFARFLLGWGKEYDEEAAEVNNPSCGDVARYIYELSANTYCLYPTVKNGYGYRSLFEALMHDLYSPWSDPKKPKTYKLVSVADCHW